MSRSCVVHPPPVVPFEGVPCELPEVVAFAPRVFEDGRGSFAELYQAARYAAAGVPDAFVQDNAAWSEPGVLRGLHLQHPHAQGKLVTVLSGAVFDVAADVRVGSPTFGRAVGVTLRAGDLCQLWVPPGFAHGYLALPGERALVTYKCTERYHPAHERTIRWDDPALGIAWPLAPSVVSEKDRAGLWLADAVARGVLPPFAPPDDA